MKKIGIVTIESFNLGNRLQNYALQNVLEKLGFQVETIQRSRPVTGKERIKKLAINFVQTVLQSKGAKFRSFNSLIHKSKYYALSDEDFNIVIDEYDYFIAGSDQIWNPYYDFVGKVDYLTFAKPKQKIAYAASFGVSELPIETKEIIAKYLMEFSHISVREKTGANIIKELCGKNVPVVLDPTLMLSADEWRKLEKKPSKAPKQKYVLVYSVERMSDKMKDAVEDISKTKKVVDVRACQTNGHEWSVGPAEFLYLIDHAEMLYTDSFHGTVFSILFHTKFKVFNREGLQMNSRIDTLLEETGMKNMNTFDNIDEKLVILREKSAVFLKNALCISENLGGGV